MQPHYDTQACKSWPPVVNMRGQCCRGKWGSADKAEVDQMLVEGKPHCFRFRVPSNETVSIKDSIRGDVSWNTDSLGDFVVLRSNGLPVYNFCVAVDDGLMNISHVIRAEEHLPNTLRQVFACPLHYLSMPPCVLVVLVKQCGTCAEPCSSIVAHYTNQQAMSYLWVYH